MLSVVTANVNGIRAAARRGGPRVARRPPGPTCSACRRCAPPTSSSPRCSTRRGSATCTWRTPRRRRRGAPASPCSRRCRTGRCASASGPRSSPESGRWVEVDVDTAVGPLTVASVYVHTGEATDEARQAEKYRFLDAMEARLVALIAAARAPAGDRVRRPQRRPHRARHQELARQPRQGRLPRGRARLPHALVLRARLRRPRARASAATDPVPTRGGRGAAAASTPTAAGASTTRSRRARLAARAVSAEVGKAATYDERWSDHAPLTVTFE